MYACVGRTLAYRRRSRGVAEDVCQFARLNGTLLETAVWDRVRAYLVGEGALQGIRRSLLPGHTDDNWQAQVHEIRTEMKRLTGLRDGLAYDLGTGKLSTTAYNAAMAANDRRLTALAAELSQAEQELQTTLEVAQRHSVDELRTTLLRRLDELAVEERQKIVGLLVERVEVREGAEGPEVRLVWRVPELSSKTA